METKEEIDYKCIKEILDNTDIDYPPESSYIDKASYLSVSFMQIKMYYEDIVCRLENNINELRKKLEDK